MGKNSKKQNKNTANTNTANGYVNVAYNSPRGLKLITSKGETVIINGSPVNRILNANGKPTRGRFGLTQIKKDVWEDLQKKYAEAPFFKADPPKLFSREEKASIIDEAEDLKDTEHGFEQIDPGKQNTEELTEDD